MKTKIIFTAVLLFIITTAFTNYSSDMERNTDNHKESSMHVSDKHNASEDLHIAMRKLWEDHIIWTRNVILCLTDQLPGTDQAEKRLLSNQDDIGNAIKPYYGNAAGEKLTSLLKPHITIAAEVVRAAKNNNSSALDDANKRWHVNADEISQFLSGANPNWELKDMKMMMDDHLKLTTDEAVARIKKDYNSDIASYDKVHEEILKMSDMLADGIVKQFPDKFKK